MEMSLELINLRKKYGDKVALNDFTYTFTPGVYGILGANGAGKSTLFRLLTDTLTKDDGVILWNGTDILSLGKQYRKEIGYMPQEQGYYSNMSVLEFLYYIGEMKAIPKKELKVTVEELLKKVGLSNSSHVKMGQLSHGMRQRALLVQALLGDPSILILDEPTAGVDPQERIHIRNLIETLGASRIVLLATHIVSDIEKISDQVLLMKQGELVKGDSPEKLVADVGKSNADLEDVYMRYCVNA